MNKPMEQANQNHLDYIQEELRSRLESKYLLGYNEHGGDLLRLKQIQLIEESINEALDLIVYLLTLKDKYGDN